jgi:hypothetical protein
VLCHTSGFGSSIQALIAASSSFRRAVRSAPQRGSDSQSGHARPDRVPLGNGIPCLSWAVTPPRSTRGPDRGAPIVVDGSDCRHGRRSGCCVLSGATEQIYTEECRIGGDPCESMRKTGVCHRTYGRAHARHGAASQPIALCNICFERIFGFGAGRLCQSSRRGLRSHHIAPRDGMRVDVQSRRCAGVCQASGDHRDRHTSIEHLACHEMAQVM